MKLTKEEVAVLDLAFRSPSTLQLPVGGAGILATQATLSNKLRQAAAEANGEPAELDLSDGELAMLRQLFAHWNCGTVHRSHELIAATVGAYEHLFPPAGEDETD